MSVKVFGTIYCNRREIRSSQRVSHWRGLHLGQFGACVSVFCDKINGIEQDKRVPILLSSIGARTYSLLRDVVAPDVPGTLPFDRISEVLTSHFQPRRLVIAERCHFHWPVQAMDESIADFDDAALRKLATYRALAYTSLWWRHVHFRVAREDTQYGSWTVQVLSYAWCQCKKKIHCKNLLRQDCGIPYLGEVGLQRSIAN